MWANAEMPIVAGCNPIFFDFVSKKDPIDADTSSACEDESNPKGLFRMRPPGKSLNRRAQGLKSEEFFPRQTVYFYQNNTENQADFKWQWLGVFIGRFGSTYDSAYYSGNSVEVDLNNPTSAGKIFDVLGRDGTLHLHFGR